MVKIRLSRNRVKDKPSYRIVVVDSRQKRNGKNLEIIGFYNPSTKPPILKINQERFKYWLNRGAQLSSPLRKLVKDEKTA